LETGLNSVPTSSMGRLFDAVASLAGIRQAISYEAQAAIELEALAVAEEQGRYAFAQDGNVFDAAPVIQAVVRDVLAGVDAGLIAARFQNGLADLILRLSLYFRELNDLTKVALSGGVFQNISLLQQSMEMLLSHDFEVYTHRLVPPNDGGLALGQAIVAVSSE
jgi:hydrogenase maturation protein HypF